MRLTILVLALLLLPGIAGAESSLEIRGPVRGEVFWDGTYMGPTPIKIVAIRGGVHLVRIHSLASGQDHEVTVAFPYNGKREQLINFRDPTPIAPIAVHSTQPPPSLSDRYDFDYYTKSYPYPYHPDHNTYVTGRPWWQGSYGYSDVYFSGIHHQFQQQHQQSIPTFPHHGLH